MNENPKVLCPCVPVMNNPQDPISKKVARASPHIKRWLMLHSQGKRKEAERLNKARIKPILGRGILPFAPTKREIDNPKKFLKSVRCAVSIAQKQSKKCPAIGFSRKKGCVIPPVVCRSTIFPNPMENQGEELIGFIKREGAGKQFLRITIAKKFFDKLPTRIETAGEVWVDLWARIKPVEEVISKERNVHSITWKEKFWENLPGAEEKNPEPKPNPLTPTCPVSVELINKMNDKVEIHSDQELVNLVLGN